MFLYILKSPEIVLNPSNQFVRGGLGWEMCVAEWIFYIRLYDCGLSFPSATSVPCPLGSSKNAFSQEELFPCLASPGALNAFAQAAKNAKSRRHQIFCCMFCMVFGFILAHASSSVVVRVNVVAILLPGSRFGAVYFAVVPPFFSFLLTSRPYIFNILRQF